MKARESYKDLGKKLALKYQPGPGTIGHVLPLAPGHENLMWDTEKGLESIVERVEPYLEATRPQKKKMKQVSDSNFGLKMVEVEEPEI